MVTAAGLVLLALLPVIIVVGLFGYLAIQFHEIEPWVHDDFNHDNKIDDFIDKDNGELV